MTHVVIKEEQPITAITKAVMASLKTKHLYTHIVTGVMQGGNASHKRDAGRDGLSDA